MRTVGVDLAAEPRATALASVQWRPDGTARVQSLNVGVEDEGVVSAITDADAARRRLPARLAGAICATPGQPGASSGREAASSWCRYRQRSHAIARAFTDRAVATTSA